jgi:hypothetical protein
MSITSVIAARLPKSSLLVRSSFFALINEMVGQLKVTNIVQGKTETVQNIAYNSKQQIQLHENILAQQCRLN